jgi:hypothetical protein
MVALYVLLLLASWRWARLRSILLAPVLVFALAIILYLPFGYWSAVGLVLLYLLVLLLLWNWVRTRRLALVLLILLATDIISGLATTGRGGVHWPYPAIVVTMGVALLLIRLWPRWRLLRSPLTGRPPPRMPPARGVLDASRWPRGARRGVTTVSVVVAFAMVVVIASASVSCLSRAAQSSRSAQRALVANALLHGQLDRVRAGEVRVASVQRDLSSRARSLLPSARAQVLATPRAAADLVELSIGVSWQEAGGPRHKTDLTGLVYTGGGAHGTD